MLAAIMLLMVWGVPTIAGAQTTESSAAGKALAIYGMTAVAVVAVVALMALLALMLRSPVSESLDSEAEDEAAGKRRAP